jgi:parallel beta-helix repeat protein
MTEPDLPQVINQSLASKTVPGMNAGVRRARVIGTASILLFAFFLAGGLAEGWALSNLPLNSDGLRFYLESVATSPASWSLALEAGAGLLVAFGLAVTLERTLKGRVTRASLLACAVLFLLSTGSGLALSAFVGEGDAKPSEGWPTTDAGVPCDYSIRIAENLLVAESRSTGLAKAPGAGEDLGSYFSGLISSNKTYCVSAGAYQLRHTIRVINQTNTTLYFAPGARIASNDTIRLLQIIGSSGIRVLGGAWVGPGRGNLAGIEVDQGSNDISVKGTDVSFAGRDGIFVRNDTSPNLRISITNNFVHQNGRYGIQDYEKIKFDALNILISGNTAVDNSAGGIYTNGVGGAEITSNTVRNTVGTTPGRIGIGVTNGENGTVKGNRVDHMFWYGIQVFYNNYTSVANNYSAFNAGGSDQSGITNDHSFYDSITNNTVVSNGQAGIHVERSWFVSVRGNIANANGRFGIEFYHGDMPVTSKGEIVGNQCSFNGQAGIILNSGVDTMISGNGCLDNSGSGIFLYNDQGQVGSSGNTVTHNLLGDDRAQPSGRTQAYGVREANQADRNMIVSNVLFNNSVESIHTVGPSSVVDGNIQDSGR